MALVKCQECGNQISTDAKACPQCGAKARPAHSKGQWLFIGLATIGIVSCIAKSQTDTEQSAAALSAVESQKSPEQRLAEKAQKAKSEAEFQSVVKGAKMLKSSMKNPDSFKLNSAIKMDDGTICYQYRSTNSFNAIVPGYFVSFANKGSQSVGDWNKFCAEKSGTDYSHARQAL